MIEKTPSGKLPDRAAEDFLTAGPRDLDQAESLMEEALLAGAEEAEVYLKTSRTSGVFLQNGFATLAGGNERGVALRVFDGKGRWGHAHASWGEASLNGRLVRQALAVLKHLPEEPIEPAAPAPRPTHPFAEIAGVVDRRVLQDAPAKKREILEIVLGDISRESRPALGITLRDGISRVALVNSRGLKACFHRTLALLTLTFSPAGGPTLVAERVGCGIGREEISEAAEDILCLGGSGQEEVIEPETMLVKSSAAPVLMRWLQQEVLPGGPEAGATREGHRIASEAMDLVDDPLLAGGIASSPFDGEGYPSRVKSLLKSGVRIGSLAERQPANSGGGSRAVRPSYREVPGPGGTNLLILPGRRLWSEMLQSMQGGVVLATLEHDARGGDPAAQARWRGIGWKVLDGRLAGDCRRFLFRASPRSLLEGVVEVSNALKFSLHRSTALGCGELLIRPKA